jgi:hypothetical protein
VTKYYTTKLEGNGRKRKQDYFGSNFKVEMNFLHKLVIQAAILYPHFCRYIDWWPAGEP